MKPLLLGLLATASTLPAPTPGSLPGANLYEKAVEVLRERFFDKQFRENKLDGLAARYRVSAQKAEDVNAQRDCLTQLLSKIPASHLAVLSRESLDYLLGELSGSARPTLGLQAVQIGDDYFTGFVLEGGPAARAGILPWEKIAEIDGEPISQSRRLDYPQKDAYLSADRDPPLRSILCRDGDEVTLTLERRPGERRDVRLKARPYSALEAARTSAQIMHVEGHSLAYLHFWFIHSTGTLELVRELFAGPFANAEGLILDLRGRGGNGVVVDPLLKMLSDWGRPIVALTDRQSRSAKDVLAYEFKQRKLAIVVGERTAGAVIPATFADIGDDTVLMFPSFTLGEYTDKLELKGGVEPDIFVERAGPYSAGDDPILGRGTKELLKLVSEDPAKRPRIFATPIQSASPPSTTIRELPSLDSLVQKMVNSLGGEKALRAHPFRTLTGQTEFIGLPMKGAFMQKAAAPDKSNVVMHLGDLLVRQGFDGATAWTETSMNGLQILSGPMADAIRQQAKFYGPLDLIESNKEVTATGFATFDNKECIELKVVGPSGGVSYLYVNTATSLITGSKANIETPIGSVESKTYLRNYREFDGLKIATEIFIDSSVQRQLIQIERVSFDPIVPEEFAVPKSTR